MKIFVGCISMYAQRSCSDRIKHLFDEYDESDEMSISTVKQGKLQAGSEHHFMVNTSPALAVSNTSEAFSPCYVKIFFKMLTRSTWTQKTQSCHPS